MVGSSGNAPAHHDESKQTQPHHEPGQFKWTNISLGEVVSSNCRLEASVYGIEGREAREILSECRWPLKTVCGDNGIARAYHRPRFKRIFVSKSEFPIYQPAQITSLDPKPAAYISGETPTDIEGLRVGKNQVLLTCSGTIGNTTLVSGTLNARIFSHDLMRIEAHNPEDAGYLYAFLRSRTGHTLINTNNYGSVVGHIEPAHLENLPIPDPPLLLKGQIHNLVMESFRLRDNSNALIGEARVLLIEALRLPPLAKLNPQLFNEEAGFQNFGVGLADLEGRLEASYHLPIVDHIENRLVQHAREVTTVGDPRISENIILPGRFKRVYVEEGQGVPFFGGKQLMELDPSNKKYLSLKHHGDRIKEQLTLHKNMVLITCSGTIGKVNIVPEHWEGWTANQHIIRVVPATENIAGYLYAWLSSDYAHVLITRFAYGAVVDEIDDKHVSRVAAPLLQDLALMQEINAKVLEANEQRYQAYLREQEALKLMDEKVIFAKGEKPEHEELAWQGSTLF